MIFYVCHVWGLQCWGFAFKLVRGLPRFAPCLEHISAEGGNVAIEVYYIYICIGV